MRYNDILSRYKYEDASDIFDRISQADSSNYRENKDIINEIVLWKLNRMPHIDEELIDTIYMLKELISPIDAATSTLSFQALNSLLNSKGFKLPMASTVLHFYYPNLYPIIDQRAYRELYGIEYPSTANISKQIAMYLQYIKDCYRYHQQNCPDIPFSEIDKILYQLDKEKGLSVRY